MVVHDWDPDVFTGLFLGWRDLLKCNTLGIMVEAYVQTGDLQKVLQAWHETK